jgi:hypothetical protein
MEKNALREFGIEYYREFLKTLHTYNLKPEGSLLVAITFYGADGEPVYTFHETINKNEL